MSRERSLPFPCPPGGRLELPGGRRWVGDESNGSSENSQPPPKNQTESLGLEGRQPPFGFGRGIFNPEV